MKALLLCFVITCLQTAVADSFWLGGVRFCYRIPVKRRADFRIMVLFGGRNSHGLKTLRLLHFDELADRHGLVLLSPSFCGIDYWEPKSGTGQLLRHAIAFLERKYHIIPRPVYMYGYSAGGQCAAHFSAWMPEKTAAWGAHACGYYPDIPQAAQCRPALITCGMKDSLRFVISRQFVYGYRERGTEVLWKPGGGGHEMDRLSLELAKAWFDALLNGEPTGNFGEDDTKHVRQRPEDIQRMFRNPLANDRIKELWLE
ncbi:MAG: hypothetical protein IJJ33_06200 [Victivallales bacterium]|nr:hypothetical protein [Victivallales bacterium]